MSIAKSFNAALYDQLTIYAAWFPVANTLKLGDFGVIDGGVFRAMGNIASFGVTFEHKQGPPTSLDFVSEGTNVVRTVANVAVDKFPEVGTLEAKLSFEFSNKDACLIKAQLTVDEMQDMHAVAQKLARIEEWEHRFRVVSSTYTGQKCLVVATAEANTKIDFSGTVDVLKQVELGKIEVNPSVTSTSSRAFTTVGRTGVVGLRLFKLGWFDRLKVLSDSSPLEVSDSWGANLEDDF